MGGPAIFQGRNAKFLTDTASVNNFINGYDTTATAAATTTLLVSSKRQQFFTGTTTQTVALPVTSTLVLGQQFEIVNTSTGVVTVNSSGGNLVQTLPAGTSVVVTCILVSGTTAASWNASQPVLVTNQSANTIYSGPSSGGSGAPSFRALVGAESMGSLITTLTASNSATLDITSISTSYSAIWIELINIIPVTDSANLTIKYSTDNGSTFASTGYYAAQQEIDDLGGTGSAVSSASSSSTLGAGISNGANQGLSGWLKINGLGGANKKLGTFQAGRVNSSGRLVGTNGMIFFNTVTAINALRFLMSSGNISAGTINVYGIRST